MAYGLSIRPSEIPEWFNDQNGSNFVTIPLDNENVSWIGCALAVGLVVHRDFDLCRDLKVKHVLDCYFHTDGGVWNKQTLVHEINVKYVPFTGQFMYWVSIPYLWFSERCNAFNECTSITASTIIDSPSVKLEMSGNRLLCNPQDFIEFSRVIKSCGWVTRIRKNEKNNCGQLIKTTRTEQERQVASLEELIDSLPSDLECSQGRRFWGGNRYTIEGKLEQPRTATLLGEILQEYSIQNHLQYSGTFPQFEIPEWFDSVNGSSASFVAMKGWKGIAVCAAFRVDRHPSLILENLDHENCRVKSNLGNTALILPIPIREILSSLKGSGFIWIYYASRGSFPPKDVPLNEWNSMDLEFGIDNEDVKVHSCGYHVVFDQSMGELIETIIQCSTASEYQLSKKRKRQQSDVNDDDDDDQDDQDDDDVNTP